MIRFACNETREFHYHSIAMYRDLMKVVRFFLLEVLEPISMWSEEAKLRCACYHVWGVQVW